MTVNGPVLFLSFFFPVLAMELLRTLPNTLRSLHRFDNKMILFQCESSQNYHCDNQGISLRSQISKFTFDFK